MLLKDLQEEDFETAIKVVIVGNGAVGKSSMIQKYCKGIFTAEYKKTIGVDFLEKRIWWVASLYNCPVPHCSHPVPLCMIEAVSPSCPV
jgi:hypothetical protein